MAELGRHGWRNVKESKDSLADKVTVELPSPGDL